MKKYIKRTLWVILAGIAVIILFTGLSIWVDSILGKDRISGLANTMIPGTAGQPDVAAYLARPDREGPFPTVIMVHEFFGLNESIISKVEGLADEGYLVIAPDTFRGSTTSWIPRAIFQVLTTDPAQINADLDTVYSWLAENPDVDPDRIGIAGFCYGGRASLAFSLHNPGVAATVIFYGAPETDPEILKNLPGPVLGIFGGADQSIPLETVNEFQSALESTGIPNQISIYDNQPHAFVTDMDSIRQGGVQAQAWGQMVEFFNQNLKPVHRDGKRPTPFGHVLPVDFRNTFWLAYEHTFHPSGGHSH